jgi:broad specificity phosphatase PhoE
MRYIEIRRHTIRHKPGKHLTQEGVDLARQVGSGMGKFDKVVTSKSPRAFETAFAFGYAVDEQAKELSAMDAKAAKQIANANTFADYARALKQHKALARWARAQAKYWRSIAQALPEGGSALLVSHGGMMEAGAVGALPAANHAEWGQGFGYCEGVRLAFDGNDFASAEILRVPSEQSENSQPVPNETVV